VCSDQDTLARLNSSDVSAEVVLQIAYSGLHVQIIASCGYNCSRWLFGPPEEHLSCALSGTAPPPVRLLRQKGYFNSTIVAPEPPSSGVAT
jgi:hypothetical protein